MMCMRLAILSGFISLSATVYSGASQGIPKSLTGSRAEIYKSIEGTQLPLHIFEPEGHKSGDKRPTMVFFFGGGWNGGSPGQFQKQCAYLASRGMVAITVEYRVKNRHGVKAVSCFKDAKSSIRWVRQHAEELGIDPDRIAAGGGSAGGHLAGALGTISAFDEPDEDASISAVPNALVLFNPALVLAPVEGHKVADPKKLAALKNRLGVEPKELSPYHHIDSDIPPTIIFHGTKDKTVPYATAKLFTDEAQKQGNTIILETYEGEGHSFFNYKENRTENFASTLKKADAFLVSIGYLQGDDTVDDFIAGL